MGKKPVKLSKLDLIKIQAREIWKRLYKTSYQLVLGFLVAILPQLPELLNQWDVYKALTNTNPFLVVISTGLISVVDNSIRSASDKLEL